MHLNFWNTEVDVMDERGRISQKYANPLLRDNEWVITNEIDRAQKEKKGLVILGIRRLAKSVIESSYIGWGATFDENSQNIIARKAGDAKVFYINPAKFFSGSRDKWYDEMKNIPKDMRSILIDSRINGQEGRW